MDVEALLVNSRRLALHGWVPEAPRAVVLYVHGVQSHAGWLFETGAALEARGVALYAPDRCGSGRSEGGRGDVASAQIWIDDYLDVLAEVRRRHPQIPLTLLGQSAGGSLAAAIACDERASFSSLLLTAPALGTQHARLSADELERRLRGKDGTLRPVPLKDEWYTDDPRCLAFIAEDPLMLRQATSRFWSAMIELERRYLDAPAWKFPSCFVAPRNDRIIDIEAASRTYRKLAGSTGLMVEMPADCHYIEFSAARQRFFGFVAQYARTAGFEVTD
jgi:alpha-beta hydrolase superfamily lysophospholipase